MKKRFLEVELKCFEVQLEDGYFTIIKRGKGRPQRIAFPKSAATKVATFCLGACEGELSVEIKETARFKGGSIFMARRLNNWGCFVRICEWRLKENDHFIIIPVGENCLGWVGIHDILIQMDDLLVPNPVVREIGSVEGGIKPVWTHAPDVQQLANGVI